VFYTLKMRVRVGREARSNAPAFHDILYTLVAMLCLYFSVKKERERERERDVI